MFLNIICFIFHTEPGPGADSKSDEYTILLGGRGRGIPRISSKVLYSFQLKKGLYFLPESQNARFRWGENGGIVSREFVENNIFANNVQPRSMSTADE